jgi:hypothetical protein
MTKRLKLKTALLLAAAANVSYASESCVPPKKGQTPLEVLECLQKGLDTLTAKTEKQQKRIAELEKENEALRQKTDAISVSGSNVGIGTKNPGAKLEVHGQGAKILIQADTVNQDNYAGIIFDEGDGGRHFEIRADGVSGAGSGRLRIIPKSGSEVVILRTGNVGIGTTAPSEKLEVAGNIKATAFKTGDIFFEKDGETLWQMFEDENGLYLKQIKTGKTYRLMLEEMQ